MIKEILKQTETWNEPDIAELIRLLNLRRDQITRLFDYCFHRVPNLLERDRTTRLIKQHGYKLVKECFAEAGLQSEKGKHSIKYVEAIIKNVLQKESLQKHREEARKLTEAVADISKDKIRPKTDMEAKKWQGMFKDI
jgi:hypothetical protein